MQSNTYTLFYETVSLNLSDNKSPNCKWIFWKTLFDWECKFFSRFCSHFKHFKNLQCATSIAHAKILFWQGTVYCLGRSTISLDVKIVKSWCLKCYFWNKNKDTGCCIRPTPVDLPVRPIIYACKSEKIVHIWLRYCYTGDGLINSTTGKKHLTTEK